MFIAVIIGIALFSLLLALRSLKHAQKVEEIGKVKEELKTSRVVYQNSSESSGSDLSSSSSS